MEPNRSSAPLRAGLALALLLITVIGLAIAQWPVFSTGFALFASGDRYDGLIAAAIHEHWFNYLSGATAPWNKVEYFHPWPNTLALNDGYFLHGLIHAALRSYGVTILLASDLAGVALRALTPVAIYLIARRHVGAGPLPALASAFIGTLSAGLAIEVIHAQFASVGPALLCLYLGLEFCDALREQRFPRAAANGIAAALLAGLLLLTSFYVTYTLLVAVLLGTAIHGILTLAMRGTPPRPGKSAIGAIALAAVAGLLAILPAVMLYLPQIRSGGLHDIAQARHYAMTPLGLLDPGLRSLLWGWARADLSASSVAQHGFGPLLLVAAVLGTLTALVRAWRGRRNRDGARGDRIVATIGLTALGLAFLVTNWWGFWPWAWLWKTLPGAGAYRVTSRFCLIVAPVLGLVAVWWLFAVRPRRFGVAFVGIGLLALALEQIAPLPIGPSRLVEETRLARIGTPPAGCEVFVATRAREGDALTDYDALYSHNVDAMIAAAYLRLPTINGISTFVPPGWNLSNPQSATYPMRVKETARSQGLKPCGLDFEALRWTSQDAPFAGVPRRDGAVVFDSGSGLTVGESRAAALDILLSGWSSVEAQGVWSVGREAVIALRVAPTLGKAVLALSLWGFSNAQDGKEIEVRLPSSGARRYRIPTSHAAEIAIPFDRADLDGDTLLVRIVIDQPEMPKASGDTRLLGISLRAVRIGTSPTEGQRDGTLVPQ